MTDEDASEHLLTRTLTRMKLGEVEINLKEIAEQREKADIRFGCKSYNHKTEQSRDYILNVLPKTVFQDVLLFVDQYDLCSLLLVNQEIYELATSKLYERVVVQLKPQFPLKYHDNRRKYVQEAGLRYLNSSIIFDLLQVLQFAVSLKVNPNLIPKFKLFIFEHCGEGDLQTYKIQSKLYTFFGKYCTDLKFMNIAITDYNINFDQLIEYSSLETIRKKIYKLFILKISQLYEPTVPANVTNLYLLLNERDLIDNGPIDLSYPRFEYLNSLQRLTCGTIHELGLEVLKCFQVEEKLKLRGLNVNHLHDEETFEELQFVNTFDKQLSFEVISDRIDLSYLTHLTLKAECISQGCHCFPYFFQHWLEYFKQNDCKISSLTLERFSRTDLHSDQFITDVIQPLGKLINSAKKLQSLFIDFQTPEFKFGQEQVPPLFVNRQDDNYLEQIFLNFFPKSSLIRKSLRVLQIDDFFSSFIYYKTGFMNSILHTCKCWGCFLVLEKLKMFIHEANGNVDASYYAITGSLLMKLRIDRPVFTPITDTTPNWNEYPIYSGNKHWLHDRYHLKECNCNEEPPFIDNIVTTYLVHQSIPIVKYISKILPNLESLMINGIYWEYDRNENGFVTTYDEMEYPQAHLDSPLVNLKEVPPGPFGEFRKHRESQYDY